MSTEQPLTTGDLSSVSAAFLRLGVSRDEFLKTDTWKFSKSDAVADMCAVLQSWVFQDDHPPLIFSFDALYLVRRIAGKCVQNRVRFLPAVWWCGNQSRTYDICRYLSADVVTTAADLLSRAEIQVFDGYQPHHDSLLDLRYLLELADRYNIVNEKIDSASAVPVVVSSFGASVAAAEPVSTSKTRTLKNNKS